MKQLKLGHSDANVSAFNLGCMYFGTAIDEERSFELMDMYHECGGNFYDTANAGESEAILGRWIQARQNRDDVFIATKVGVNMPPRIPIGLSKQTIKAECDASLKRLGVDVIDLYYAHIDDRDTPLEETLEALNDLVVEGKIRHLGCSNYQSWRIAEAREISKANGWAEFCCVQQRHSYLRPENGRIQFSNTQVPVTSDLLDYVTTKDDFAIIAYSTLIGGVYTPPYTIPDNYQPNEYDAVEKQARLNILDEIAKETESTMNQVVLAWLTQNTPNMFALISTSSLERMKENLDADKLTLTPDQLDRLNNV